MAPPHGTEVDMMGVDLVDRLLQSMTRKQMEASGLIIMAYTAYMKVPHAQLN